MNIFLKKSKVFWVCIIPFLSILASIYSIFNPNSSSPFPVIYSAHTTGRMILILFHLALYILVSAIYLYIGIVFFRKRTYTSYKVLAFANFFWFIFNTIGALAITFFDISILSNPVSFFTNAIIYSIVIAFQIVTIYLLVTYNQKNLITTYS